MKRCTKCGVEKSESDFYKRRNRPSGLTPWCAVCLRGLRRANHAAHSGDVNYKIAACERVARWRENNPDRARALDQSKYEKNKVAYKARASARRALVRGVRVERVSRRYVYECDGGVCHLCSTPVQFKDMHLDHVIPLSRGGEHSHANLRVAHAICNLRRGAKPLR